MKKFSAVFGAIWIDAPLKKYLEAVRDIERFESGGSFKVTKRISAPPRTEDFVQLHLPEEDVKDLQTCEIGSCEVKLGEEALRRLAMGEDAEATGAGRHSGSSVHGRR